MGAQQSAASREGNWHQGARPVWRIPLPQVPYPLRPRATEPPVQGTVFLLVLGGIHDSRLREGLHMNPYLITEPTCISFSGGRTSAYMLYQVLQANDGLPDDAVVCFANTGKEDEATLEFVQACSDNWNVPISWLEYRNDERKFAVVDFDTASRSGEPFDSLIEKKNYLPNVVSRFCTEELKVKPIKAFTRLEDDQTMVGVRADEPIRIAKLLKRGMLLPLVSGKVTKSIVRDFWRATSFDLQLEEHDGVTPDGNCDLCFLKGVNLLVSSIARKPTKAVWWAQKEECVGARFRSDRPSYSDMLKFTQNQSDMFADEPIDCFCGD